MPRFDFIRYANCWEDADILLEALNVTEGGVYLSIASSGDNTFSILSHNPSLVVAVDISTAQLACVELRKIAFANLSYEEVLQFLGIRQGANRIVTYKKICHNLSSDSQQFWGKHQEFIKMGIIHVGKFEKYFQLFRRWILPLIHNKKKIRDLLRMKGESAQITFYNKEWNTWRWQMFFKIFFSRRVMGHLGRDLEFFRYVEGDVASRIADRAQYALTVLPTDKNPYLEYILTENFNNSLPFYLRKCNFEVIRQNLDKLSLFKGNLDEVFQINKILKFDGFNLSDIFEYINYNEYISELEKILKFSNKGARLVYWNMLVDRKSPDVFRNRLKSLDDLAEKLFLQNKAFFYKALIIEEAL